MASPTRIAIIGAGPAGLTLARLLNVSGAKVDVTLFELDASPTARSEQGGTLDLHADTGLAAIRKCGLWDSFRKYARYQGQEMILADKNATELVHISGKGEKQGVFDRPEIDRERLKEILLESVSQESVRWGRKLKEVMDDGTLQFDGRPGLEGPFDLVVGADGAWSKVRVKLNKTGPRYSGISGYEMEIPEPKKTCPHVDSMVGRGAFFGVGDRKFLNAQRMGNDSLKCRSWYVTPEGEAQETLDRLGKKETLDKILGRYQGWTPEITEILRQGDLDTLRVWPLYELPVGYEWEHQEGFTLIGDASSLSTPFSGEGVNKAMKDSLQLAEMIEKSQDPENDLSLDQAILEYEKLLFPRSKKVQAETEFNKQNGFNPGAPTTMLTGLLRVKTADSPSFFIRMLGTAPFVFMMFTYLWIRTQIGWAVRRYWRKV